LYEHFIGCVYSHQKNENFSPEKKGVAFFSFFFRMFFHSGVFFSGVISGVISDFAPENKKLFLFQNKVALFND
jgi:hypothetical protein